MNVANPLVQSLALETPVVQAPMAGGTTTPELVAAVSGAGGLGSLGAGYLEPDMLAETGQRIRALTAQPFAVNLFIPGPRREDCARVEASNRVLDGFRTELGVDRPKPRPRYAPDFDEQFQAVLATRPAVFSFTFGVLDADRTARLHEAGITIVGTATTVAEARALQTTGVDAIVAQGAEAGGHRGTFMHDFNRALIGTMALVPQVVDAVDVPVIASGGIMDARGVAAALMLGASAVQMGSAFLACAESGAKPAHRAAVGNAADTATVVTRAFSGRAARGIQNRFIDAMTDAGVDVPDYPIQNAWTKDIRAAAGARDEPAFMSLWAGQAAAMAQRKSAAHIINELRAQLAQR